MVIQIVPRIQLKNELVANAVAMPNDEIDCKTKAEQNRK